MGLLGIGGATPSEEPKKINGNEQEDQNTEKTSKNVSIWDSDENGTVSVEEQKQAVETAVLSNKTIQMAKKMGFDPQPFIDALESQFEDIITNVPKTIGNFIIPVQQLVTNANNKVQGYIDIIKDKANEFVDIKNNEIKEKDSIKEQYPYYSQDDVDARYEIEHMPFRSAELMEALHSGERPAKVLADFNEKQNKIVNGTYQERVDGIQDDVDGMTITEKYDEHNRIISWVTVFDTPENGKNTSEYHYNSDGSYTVISNEGDGYRYTYKYDNHGKLLSEQFNDETPEDFSKTKFEGDY